jgi:hypothetical protein
MSYLFEATDETRHPAARPDMRDRAAALSQALTDCCHPRAARLQARLTGHLDADQLALLRGEVLNLLALSFGAAEAQRRLQDAAPHKLQ